MTRDVWSGPGYTRFERRLFRRMDACRFLVEVDEHGRNRETCTHPDFKPAGRYDWHMECCHQCKRWKKKGGDE
jgi:hypothetical protein